MTKPTGDNPVPPKFYEAPKPVMFYQPRRFLERGPVVVFFVFLALCWGFYSWLKKPIKPSDVPDCAGACKLKAFQLE